jgi:hypothetical protein
MGGDGNVCGTTVYLKGVSWCCSLKLKRCEHTVLPLVLIALFALADKPIFTIFTIFQESAAKRVASITKDFVPLHPGHPSPCIPHFQARTTIDDDSIPSP